MYVRAGVGVSEAGDPTEALEEALEWGVDRPDSVFCVFSPTANDPDQVRKDLRAAVRSKVPYGREYQLFGVSSAGEISSDGYHEGSVVVMAFEFTQYVATGLSVEEGLSRDAEAVGRIGFRDAVRSIRANPLVALSGVVRVRDHMELARFSPVHALLMPDGLCCLENPDATCDMLRGVMNELGGPLPVIFGGLTGDDMRLEQCYAFDDRRVYTDALVTWVWFSSLKCGHAIHHGFEPTGHRFKVTAVDGTEILELDGKPALEAYAEVLGVDPEAVDTETLFTYPFGIPTPTPYSEHILRTCVETDPEKGSITALNKIPEGITLEVMQPGDLEGSFRDAARSALKAAGDPDDIAAVIVFNCVARHQIVDTDTAVELLRREIGEDVPIIGFNCYGEIGNTESGTVAHLNQTVSIFVIGDELIGR